MLSPQILGKRYRLAEVLGTGGMSVVWRATDERLGRPVAVKILAGEFAADPEARAAVLSEAQAIARIAHPNICTVFDYGESRQVDGQPVPYVVMELLDGPSLADVLEEGPLPPAEGLRVAAQVAAALAAAHAHGLVHRDVKPGNVILTASGAKVFDFGIAARAGTPDEADPDGRILATFSCVAPERLSSGLVLPSSDMFSWGVLLFRVLTGRLPWPSWVGLVDRVAAAAPLPAIDGIPAKVRELYRRCLSENPGERPTAAAAAAAVGVTLRTPPAPKVLLAGGIPEDPTASDDRTASNDRTASDDRTAPVAVRLPEGQDRRQRRRRVAMLAAGLAAVLAATAIAITAGHDPTDVDGPGPGPSGAAAGGVEEGGGTGDAGGDAAPTTTPTVAPPMPLAEHGLVPDASRVRVPAEPAPTGSAPTGSAPQATMVTFTDDSS